MLAKTILYDGSKEPAPPPVPLKAGPLTMQFEPGTGYLRYIRIGDHEISVCDWGKNRISLLWISRENYHLKPMQAVAKKRENLSQTPEAEPTARER